MRKPSRFQHTITLVITTEEDNPDMPSLNVNALAGHLRDHAAAELTPAVANVDHTLQYVEVVVAEARRTA